MTPSPTLFASLWALWMLIWIVAALGTSRSVERESFRSRLVYMPPTAAGAILVLVRPDRPALLALRFPLLSALLAWAGLGLVIAGLGFAVVARFYLGRLWSGTVTFKESHEIVRSGPYAVTRHPIYTGLLTAFVGTALFDATAAATAGVGLVWLGLWLKLRREENLLREHFGEAYDDYCAEVPALVPRLR